MKLKPCLRRNASADSHKTFRWTTAYLVGDEVVDKSRERVERLQDFFEPEAFGK